MGWAKTAYGNSKDKPGLDFGQKDIEEVSLRRSIATAAKYYDRSYLVAEVKNNLLADERKKSLAEFDGEKFKKIALVALGEPPGAFKKRWQEQLLADKKWDAVGEVKKTFAANEKKRAAEKAAKEKAAAREAAAKERAAAVAARVKKAEEEKAEEQKAEEEKVIDLDGEET